MMGSWLNQKTCFEPYICLGCDLYHWVASECFCLDSALGSLCKVHNNHTLTTHPKRGSFCKGGQICTREHLLKETILNSLTKPTIAWNKIHNSHGNKDHLF